MDSPRCAECWHLGLSVKKYGDKDSNYGINTAISFRKVRGKIEI